MRIWRGEASEHGRGGRLSVLRVLGWGMLVGTMVSGRGCLSYRLGYWWPNSRCHTHRSGQGGVCLALDCGLVSNIGGQIASSVVSLGVGVRGCRVFLAMRLGLMDLVGKLGVWPDLLGLIRRGEVIPHFKCLFIVQDLVSFLILFNLVSPVPDLFSDLGWDWNLESLQLVKACKSEGHDIETEGNMDQAIFIKTVITDGLEELESPSHIIELCIGFKQLNSDIDSDLRFGIGIHSSGELLKRLTWKSRVQ